MGKYDALFQEPQQAAPKGKYSALFEEPAAKPSLSLSQAAFPGASKEYAPQRSAMPWTFDMSTGQPLFRDRGQTEQRAVAGVGDLLSLPTRAAGAVAGSAGYTGATGGLPFREALASPETGLMRPARQALGNRMGDQMAYLKDPNNSMMGKVGAGLGLGIDALGYMGASVLEDPAVIAGGLAKVAPKTLGRGVRAVGTPIREVAADLAPKVRGRAERIQQTVLRPRQGDWNAGFELADVEKHGVQGTVDEVIAKSQAKIDAAAKELKQKIQTGADGGARVDLYGALDAAKAKLKQEGSADLVSKLDPIFKEFKSWAKAAGGNVDLLKAQEFKQTMGAHGAWEKRAMNLPEKYQSKAAQAVYMGLKEQIEKAAPEGVKELNKTLSDLIPIRNAAAYRKIVADRNNPIGLSDMLSAMTAVGNGPAGLAMLGATRFTKSGFGAKTLYSLAQSLDRAKTPAEAAFYANKLKALGIGAAELDALRAMPEASQSANVLPFRKVAEADNTDQRRASR